MRRQLYILKNDCDRQYRLKRQKYLPVTAVYLLFAFLQNYRYKFCNV
jgi:hypothetical protein